MASEATNDFFWQDLPTSDNAADLQLQRISINNIVSQQEQTQDMQVHIQPESSPSPPNMLQHSNIENVNNNNRLITTSSPNSLQEPLLPPGVVNPDAIIPQSRSYTCRICQVTFPNKSAVTVHSRVHTNHEGKPYRCGFCGKGFSTNFYLKQHERIHNGQKPYKCPMCENSFKQLSHVQQHVRTHTGVRPYKCNWEGCGKAFLQQSHLKSHIARHSPKPNNGVRPYKCHWPDCGKSFGQISNLKSHTARHTPKHQKQRKDNELKKVLPVESGPGKHNLGDEMDEGSFSLVSVSPDVIGQAAAAANIVPVSLDYESICPFLCPGCSKLYVREATFKKHLEECKTKLQLSISATAAALGIDPPPLPPLSTQMGGYPVGEVVTLPMEVNLTDHEDSHGGLETPPKRSRKSPKPQSHKINIQHHYSDHHHQQQHEQIIVEMPLDVSLGNCSPQLSDGSLNDSTVKQEFLHMPLDGGQNGNVMFKIPQQMLNTTVVGSNSTDSGSNINNINQFFSSVVYNQSEGQLIDNNVFNNQQLVTSSSISLPIVASQPLSSSQSIMLSGASVNAKQDNTTKAGTSGAGHSTINQAALRWQWDQSVPRMNFP